MGVNVERDFEPRYVIPEKKKEVVRALRAEAKDADEIFLATDPDREGEAISWHLRAALPIPSETRSSASSFTRSTKGAIEAAFANARGRLTWTWWTPSRQRRILDRLVGYTLSPC